MGNQLVRDSTIFQLPEISFSSTSAGMEQHEIEVNLALFEWLASQTDFPKLYWRDRDGEREFAAVGNGAPQKGVPYFISRPFSAASSEWEPFQNFSTIYPKKIYREKNGREILHSVQNDIRILERIDSPNYDEWCKNVETAIDKIKKNELQKVVLARKVTLTCSGPIDPLKLLEKLHNTSSRAYFFMIQINPTSAFLGASPERLYKRIGNQIESEAVAGTWRLDESDGDFLQSRKEVCEHQLVSDAIGRFFSKHCHDVSETPRSVLKLTHLQHLYSEFRGRLKEGVTDGDILADLHPTPALGGQPREKALALIDQLEPFDRGWYGSPIGWVEGDAAEFAVGIRSALIDGNKLHLFSGAGIVDGSEPEKEWEEIENKIKGFLDLYE